MNQPFKFLMIATLASPMSWACSYDGQFNNPFTESYPGALNVAIVTQQAIEQQSIVAPPPLEGSKGLRRVTWWLNLLEKMSLNLPKGTYIYLVDSQLWSQYETPNHIAIHVQPPKDKSKVVQLTEATLHNLINKRLTYKQALDLELILET